FGNRGSREVLAGFEKMFDFPENPRVSDGCAANHDPVYFILPPPGHGFVYTIHVAIAENGNPDPRIAFDLSDECPVGRTFVHLSARSTVDAQCLYTHVLQPLSNFVDILGVIIPT